MEDHPEAIVFYQKWGIATSPKAELFRKIENKFQKNMSLLFPEASPETVKIFHAYIHGLVTSPFSTPQEAFSGVNKLISLGLMGG